METFQFVRVKDAAQAVSAASHSKTAQQGAQVRFIAGGTTLLDLMKLDVEHPSQLLDINRLPFDKVEKIAGGGLKIGALVRNSDLARDANVQKDYPVLSQALLSGASAQLRNMATTGGNLLQRTRCMYFRDNVSPCNKREPGTGCAAIEGLNRMLAILGTSEHCIATNPSDMNVALAALETVIHIQGVKGERSVPISDFHLPPGDAPDRETVLEPGDLVTHVTLPPPGAGKQIALFETSRPCLLRVRASLRRRGGDRGRRSHHPRPRRTRRGGHETVALTRSRKSAHRRGGGRSRLPQSRRSRACRRKAAKPERLQGRTRKALPRARAQSRHETRLTRTPRP